ncbi:Hha toxicity attenuator TomB [Escherichia coli]|nr:Hha toxicity attenuator TomB [Escherichia coli]
MDEYSPKRHDIAQLKFLCETLYHDCLANLEESNHGWVNDPTSAINLQLNELIEHIATFALNYKIKYNEDNKLIEQIDEYLDDTFMLFSSYGINMQDLQKWRKSGNRLFPLFCQCDERESCEFILLELLQPWVEVCPKNL